MPLKEKHQIENYENTIEEKMTPKKQALQLYLKYDQLTRDFTRGVSIKDLSKECSLIAVDEMIKLAQSYEESLSLSQTTDHDLFLKEVKKEIENL